MESFEKESIGRFGRIFRHSAPLYSNPTELAQLGAKNGPMDGGNTPQFTNNVPLGMIFLGQFIDHDITFDTSSNFSSINNPNAIENVRSANLDLDCVFGGGPEDEPFMYANAQSTGLYLLTGKTNNNDAQANNLRKHDLPRTATGTAIIGDPRNDENRVISQLQLAFIRFYNYVYDELKTANPGKSPEEIHREARQTVTWHYQWIVVNEFLPTLCGNKIVNDILGKGRKVYQPTGEAFIPVEFSVAAYRFGHSMIAQNLKLKLGGATHSIFSPQFGQGFAKLTNINQVIDWEVFFDFDGTYQRAETLDTKLASDLLELPFIPSPNPADKSLATRNLRRGQSFLLPSGESVAEKIGVDANDINTVKTLVNTLATTHGVDISSGTPLWFYILAEAEAIGRVDTTGNTPGEGLGPVGATIVAEVILGLLELDHESYLGSNRDWIPTLGNNGEFTMKDLLEDADKGIEF
ncbi:MAG TPA: heme peroxidase family protein [Saprospiraceae bacterium]|nr:heme peroxidase family protein [Saprospiraceae bacterium]HMQ81890.1 heme peroxidase family protein [Saprospiraceae bacterium]